MLKIDSLAILFHNQTSNARDSIPKGDLSDHKIKSNEKYVSPFLILHQENYL